VAAHLAICEGDDGIPLWALHPTVENVPRNKVIGWMDPYVLCIVLVDYEDGTSLVAYDGILSYAVTGCLFEVS
jgi:hypothetical protein